MKSKFLKWLALSFCGCLAVGFAACGGNGDGGGGDVDPADLNGGKALNYVLLDDDTYGVTVGECYTLPEITIPAKYNGKTVSTVLSNFFVNAIDQEGNQITIAEKDVVTYSVILREGVTTIEPGAFRGNSLKRLDLAASVVNFGNSDEAWQKGHPTALIEICNRGNLPLDNKETQGNYGWISREADYIYTPTSGERKMTMDENGMVTFVDTQGKKALVDYCGTNSVLTVPADVDYIYENACWFLDTLKEINIPGTCKSVETLAFNYCVNVEVINIANGVETIGYAFTYIDNLIYATIPPSATVHKDAFKSNIHCGVVCYAKSQTDYNGKVDNVGGLYDVIDGVHRTADGYAYAVTASKVILLKYFGNESEITIADTYDEKPVTEVYNLAFYDNDYIKKLVVGNNVTKIGEFAFQNCDNLFEVVLSDSVKKVFGYAFAECGNLTKLTIGASVELTHGGQAAFSGCYRLIEVYNRSTHENALGGITSSVTPENIYTEEGGSKITVENGFVLYTDGDDCWVVNYIGDETEIVIPDKVTGIWKNAFYQKSITKVTIGNGVTKINDKAFSTCDNLTDVTIGTGVDYIGDAAFNCSNLKEIRYLGSVSDWSTIEKAAWNGWKHSNLEKVVCNDDEVPY